MSNSSQSDSIKPISEFDYSGLILLNSLSDSDQKLTSLVLRGSDKKKTQHFEPNEEKKMENPYIINLPSEEIRLSSFIESLKKIELSSETSSPIKLSINLLSQSSFFEDEDEKDHGESSDSDQEEDSKSSGSDSVSSFLEGFKTPKGGKALSPKDDKGEGFSYHVTNYFKKVKGFISSFGRKSPCNSNGGSKEEIGSPEDPEHKEVFKSVYSVLKQGDLDTMEKVQQNMVREAELILNHQKELVHVFKKYGLEPKTIPGSMDYLLVNECQRIDFLTNEINVYKDAITDLCKKLTKQLREKYKIWVFDLIEVERLSVGYFNEIYLTYDKKSRTLYALKKVKQESGISDSNFQIFAMNQLAIYLTILHANNPNLLNILAIEFDPVHMEYYFLFEMGLGTLKEYKEFLNTQGIHLTKKEIEGLALELKAQTDELKKIGIYHRDIKPENILFSEKMTVKLINFDLACLENSVQKKIIAGSPFYMAPELKLGYQKGDVTASYDPYRTDFYSIGGTICFMIADKNTKSVEDLLLESNSQMSEVHPFLSKIITEREISVHTNQTFFSNQSSEKIRKFGEFTYYKFHVNWVQNHFFLNERKLLQAYCFQHLEKFLRNQLENDFAPDNYFDYLLYAMNLANLFCYQNKGVEGLKLLDSIRKRIPKKEKLLIVYRLKVKADILVRANRNLKALEIYKKAKRIIKKYLSNMTQLLAKIYYSMALLLRSEKQYKKALKNMTTCLQIVSTQHEHPVFMIKIYEQIGKIYCDLEKYPDAQKYFDRSFRHTCLMFGEDHPKIARQYCQLGLVYNKQRNWEIAFETLDKSIDFYEKFEGNKSKRYAGVLVHIASTYRNQGNETLALKIYLNALEIYLTHGEIQLEIANLCAHIGNMYEKSRKFKDAVAYTRKAIEVKRKIFGDIHTEISREFCRIASIYKRMSRFKDVLQNFTNALEVETLLYGETHPRIGKLRKKIGKTYMMTHDWEGAKKNFNQALEIYIMHYTKHQRDLAKIYMHMGNLSQAQRKYDDAISHYGEAQSILKKSQKQEGVEIAIIQSKMAHLNELRGRHSDAINNIRKAIELYVKMKGDKSEKVEKWRYQLQRLLYATGKFNEYIDVANKLMTKEIAKIEFSAQQQAASLKISRRKSTSHEI